MDVSFATAPGSADRPNEDWVGATSDAVVVLDGLSAPEGFDNGCLHGTVWYVRRLGSQLVHLASVDPDTALAEHLRAAIAYVAELHADTCDLDHPGTPSATVAILRTHDQRVDYLVLSDALVAIETPTGIVVHTDPSVDHAAAELKAAVLRERLGTPEHAERKRAMVTGQRKLRNVSGGYWVAAGNSAAADHAVTGSLPLGDVRRAAVLSDGAAVLVDYGLATWPDVLDFLTDSGPTGLIERVRKAEADDPSGKQWPRFKPSDDATAAICRF